MGETGNPAASVLQTLDAIATAVPNLWYLSCNPATLARDVAYLAKRGYVLALSSRAAALSS